MVVIRRWAVVFGLCFGTGCAPAPRDAPLVPRSDSAAVEPSLPPLCERTDRSDRVRDVFCASPASGVTSLAELETTLGLTEKASAALLAHSTALSGQLVSELNPRAILATRNVLVAFSRGIQQVEIAALDERVENHYNFYLLQFKQACNDAADGCRPGDLYTPSIESNWQQLALEDDEDLKNSASDCRQCHQRGRAEAILLMREYYSPWTHFFGPDIPEPTNYPEPTGGTLLRDYLRAHADESYANLDTAVLSSTVPLTLENLVFQPQPVLFRGSQIVGERWPWKDGSYAATPQRSATWDGNFAAFKRGEQLALPYYAPRATDAVKQAQLTAAYQRYRSGELDAADLPDFADIFPDDPRTRAEIGLQTEPGASPPEALIQACGTCHNDVLDQTVSRARFNVALSTMSRDELDAAIARIQAPRDAHGAMPPPGHRQLDPQSVPQLLEYLRGLERPAEDDALLLRAASLGMTGEAYIPEP